MMDDNLQEFRHPELYDAENQWAADDDFYLQLAKRIGDAVLDVACGTGRLTRAIAAAGLRVTGVDVMLPMLERARRLSTHLTISWIHADCRTLALSQRFKLAVMTGHAFQNLLSDADQHLFLARMHDHLEPGGILAFETRNLAGRTYGHTIKPTLWRSFQDDLGRWIDVFTVATLDTERMIDHVDITRTVRQTGETWASKIALRYTSVEHLNHLLAQHGFTVVEQYGDWSRGPVAASTPEIITVCQR
jgi:2-polyprenyl-3-methyl-5-hydroxy-6-metoxy-1,4-benzoquinol methylase